MINDVIFFPFFFRVCQDVRYLWHKGDGGGGGRDIKTKRHMTDFSISLFFPVSMRR